MSLSLPFSYLSISFYPLFVFSLTLSSVPSLLSLSPLSPPTPCVCLSSFSFFSVLSLTGVFLRFLFLPSPPHVCLSSYSFPLFSSSCECLLLFFFPHLPLMCVFFLIFFFSLLPFMFVSFLFFFFFLFSLSCMCLSTLSLFTVSCLSWFPGYIVFLEFILSLELLSCILPFLTRSQNNLSLFYSRLSSLSPLIYLLFLRRSLFRTFCIIYIVKQSKSFPFNYLFATLYLCKDTLSFSSFLIDFCFDKSHSAVSFQISITFFSISFLF